MKMHVRLRLVEFVADCTHNHAITITNQLSQAIL